MTNSSQKLSVIETAGYSCGDAAANFVFMTMVLFQLNFYTDTFGLTASAAAATDVNIQSLARSYTNRPLHKTGA